MRPTPLLAVATVSLLASAAQAVVTISVNTQVAISKTAPEFVSSNFDWHTNQEEFPAWAYNTSIVNVDLNDPSLLDLATHFGRSQGSYIRVGGSEGDVAIYELPGQPCPQNFTDAGMCLTLARWDAINAWAIASGMRIAFGLNCMWQRPSNSAPQDLSFIEGFLAYTAQRRNYTALAGFEYGNEKTMLDPTVYGQDFIRVRALITKYWGDLPPQQRPILIGPDANIENLEPGWRKWFAAFWKTVGPAAAINASTVHMYVGYGLNPQLPQQAWNATFLAQMRGWAADVASLARASGLSSDVQLWVGETALAWHSGRNGTTDAFASGPWTLIQLGSIAAEGFSVQCRQTLRGGYYSLIDPPTNKPNPDYFTSLMHKTLAGGDRGVLSASVQGDDAGSVFAFAYCAAPGAGAPAGAVTLVYVNLSPRGSPAISVQLGGVLSSPRQEYVLTADSDSARVMALNGANLTYAGPGTLPAFTPLNVNDGSALSLPARSYGFVVFPQAGAPACA